MARERETGREYGGAKDMEGETGSEGGCVRESAWKCGSEKRKRWSECVCVCVYVL